MCRTFGADLRTRTERDAFVQCTLGSFLGSWRGIRPYMMDLTSTSLWAGEALN